MGAEFLQEISVFPEELLAYQISIVALQISSFVR